MTANSGNSLAGTAAEQTSQDGSFEADQKLLNKRKKQTVVIIARHAERQDYVMRDRGENFVPLSSRPWDSPLSTSGYQQGLNLGRIIHQTLMDLGLSPVNAVYSSPFTRCLQTANAAIHGVQSSDDREVKGNPVDGTHTSKPSLFACIEEGLSESINENWYRSWCLPESNGTWGFRPLDANGHQITNVDMHTLHEAAKKPVQHLIRFTTSEHDKDDIRSELEFIDWTYQSHSRIDEPYCWGRFESRKDQRNRMHAVLDLLAKKHDDETFLCISHGGPITHLYEKLTGNHWSRHGESTYACFSIYIQYEGQSEWQPLVVNQTTVKK